MYVKLTKDHPAGFGKGHIIKCRNRVHFEDLITSKKGESAEVEDYKKFKSGESKHHSDYKVRLKADADKLIKEAKSKD